jgi:hypothetical protein
LEAGLGTGILGEDCAVLCRAATEITRFSCGTNPASQPGVHRLRLILTALLFALILASGCLAGPQPEPPTGQPGADAGMGRADSAVADSGWGPDGASAADSSTPAPTPAAPAPEVEVPTPPPLPAIPLPPVDLPED